MDCEEIKLKEGNHRLVRNEAFLRLVKSFFSTFNVKSFVKSILQQLAIYREFKLTVK